jgi:hypothetical protein
MDITLLQDMQLLFCSYSDVLLLSAEEAGRLSKCLKVIV